MHFYPRSPCGERRRNVYYQLTNVWISIHALLAESDQTALLLRLTLWAFLSTLSLRRATKNKLYLDSGYLFLSTLSLRRATLQSFRPAVQTIKFLSTLSLRRATFPLEKFAALPVLISIHALLAESDYIMIITICIVLKFLSTLSLRRATSGTARHT